MLSIEKTMYKYIVFEGNDGSGKTTIAKEIYERLPDPKIYTKEPGSPHLPFCQSIREIIIHGNEQDLADITYAHLFYADAHEHIKKVVEPALFSGTWVVSDRCVLSNKAYWPKVVQFVHKANHELLYSLFPTVFYLDVRPEECLRRITSREKEINQFEREHVMGKIDLIHSRYQNYVLPEMRESDSINNYEINNDDRPVEDVIEVIWGVIRATFQHLVNS